MRNIWEHFIWCMRHYADGAGRANRAEYWSFILYEFVFLIVAVILDVIVTSVVAHGQHDQASFLPIFTGLTTLGFVVPSFALLSRRLHDLGMSGWLVLISFIPSVGGLFSLVISLIPGQLGPNQYGPPPGAVETEADAF